MTLGFATSARSSVGLEWEIMLADRGTGDLVGRAPEILDELAPAIELERFSLTSELLTNTVDEGSLSCGGGCTRLPSPPPLSEYPPA